MTTLFTALVVTRAIVVAEWLAYSVEVKSLSIGFGKYRKASKLAAATGPVGESMNFHIMRFKWVNLTVSLIFLVGLLALTFQRFGGFALSIDFAGGIKIEMKTSDKLNAETLRNFFEKEKISAIVQLVDEQPVTV